MNWVHILSRAVWSVWSFLLVLVIIGFAFVIEYADPLGHRGLSHSLLFAAAWSLIVCCGMTDDQRLRGMLDIVRQKPILSAAVRRIHFFTSGIFFPP